MLPRQYSPNPKVTFPQMNHVSCHVLSETPSTETLRQAIDEAMAAHPLLRCHVEGDGEPEKRIDLFQMVRQGDNHPCTFVVDDNDEDHLLLLDPPEPPKGSADKKYARAYDATPPRNADNHARLAASAHYRSLDFACPTGMPVVPSSLSATRNHCAASL